VAQGTPSVHRHTVHGSITAFDYERNNRRHRAVVRCQTHSHQTHAPNTGPHPRFVPCRCSYCCPLLSDRYQSLPVDKGYVHCDVGAHSVVVDDGNRVWFTCLESVQRYDERMFKLTRASHVSAVCLLFYCSRFLLLIIAPQRGTHRLRSPIRS
jgi:hypothetical protein